jgi:N-methylhydantoinase A
VLPYGAEGTFELDLEASKSTIQEKIAGPLGYDIHQAALGIIRLCNTNMSGAIRSVSVARGFDPRDFSLVAFGGAGPMHINALLQETGVPRAIIPYHPGVLCAIGCLSADFRRDFVQTVNRPLRDIGMSGIRDVLTRYESKGKSDLIASEIEFTDILNLYEFEMQYEGQLHTIKISFDTLPMSEKVIRDEFEKAYARRFKYNMPGMETRVVNIRCSTIGIRPKLDLRMDADGKGGGQAKALKAVRPVYFDGAFVDTPVYDRSKLRAGETIAGPALIEQRDSTTILEPHSKIEIDEYHNMIMETV